MTCVTLGAKKPNNDDEDEFHFPGLSMTEIKNSMAFQAWKTNFNNSMTFQVFHDPYKLWVFFNVAYL